MYDNIICIIKPLTQTPSLHTNILSIFSLLSPFSLLILPHPMIFSPLFFLPFHHHVSHLFSSLSYFLSITTSLFCSLRFCSFLTLFQSPNLSSALFSSFLYYSLSYSLSLSNLPFLSSMKYQFFPLLTSCLCLWSIANRTTQVAD